MGASQPVVQVRGLVKRYGGLVAVDHIDLDVPEGEIFGILGRNGAGKTTTVECIQGLRAPDDGTIRVLGLDPTRDRERLRSLVGSQLQESALPDRMLVSEAVKLFATRRSVDVSDLLAAWGLAEKRRTPFARLSGGQQQRLLIVLALLNAPQVVFLDEMTQGLDPLARRETWEVIRAVRDQGTTVVLVTHFADEAEALCDRIVVIRDGKVATAGTAQELVVRHAHSARITVSSTSQESIEPRDLQSIGGVDQVQIEGKQIQVVGSPRMIPFVCAELVARGAINGDFRITQPTLEDAVLDMIGGHR